MQADVREFCKELFIFLIIKEDSCATVHMPAIS